MKMTQFVRRCNSLLHWSFYCPCSRRQLSKVRGQVL